MEPTLALERINALEPARTWELVGALDSGSTGEAFEVRAGEQRAVLKSTGLTSPDVLEQMSAVVQRAIRLGWPAAPWLQWGVTPQQGYVLLDWREGEPAQSLTPAQADALVSANSVQAGLAASKSSLFDWSQRFETITAANSSLLSKCEKFSAKTRILATRLRASCMLRGDPLCHDDLVHGDFTTDNVLLHNSDVTIIDTQSVGRGSRVIDLATMGVHCIAWEQGDATAERFLAAAVDAGGWNQTMRCAAGRALIAVAHGIDNYSGYADTLAERFADLPDRVPT